MSSFIHGTPTIANRHRSVATLLLIPACTIVSQPASRSASNGAAPPSAESTHAPGMLASLNSASLCGQHGRLWTPPGGIITQTVNPDGSIVDWAPQAPGVASPPPPAPPPSSARLPEYPVAPSPMVPKGINGASPSQGPAAAPTPSGIIGAPSPSFVPVPVPPRPPGSQRLLLRHPGVVPGTVLQPTPLGGVPGATPYRHPDYLTCECDPGFITRPGEPCVDLSQRCAPEGAQASDKDNTYCCPGLTLLSPMQVNNGQCVNTGFGFGVCTRCGDGTCGLGESHCNCPADCRR